ncbi:hypothetical protein GJ496_009972 [Pomphorhynchus laevis]|nr:hypothetical protein GJ496_009972 [Pomphorhynchus laevis]
MYRLLLTTKYMMPNVSSTDVDFGIQKQTTHWGVGPSRDVECYHARLSTFLVHATILQHLRYYSIFMDY